MHFTYYCEKFVTIDKNLLCLESLLHASDGICLLWGTRTFLWIVHRRPVARTVELASVKNLSATAQCTVLRYVHNDRTIMMYGGAPL
jgi:hypothetical protein